MGSVIYGTTVEMDSLIASPSSQAISLLLNPGVRLSQAASFPLEMYVTLLFCLVEKDVGLQYEGICSAL